jgi:hypothetical protein
MIDTVINSYLGSVHLVSTRFSFFTHDLVLLRLSQICFIIFHFHKIESFRARLSSARLCQSIMINYIMTSRFCSLRENKELWVIN